jgi:predicted amidohydrolase
MPLLAGITLVALMTTLSAPQTAQPPKTLARFTDFHAVGPDGAPPVGWSIWTPRSEISPAFSVDANGGRTGKGALVIRGNGNAAAVGSWRTEVAGVVPGKAYRFTAWYRRSGKVDARRAVIARLDWLDAKGERARMPDYALESGTEAGWTRFSHVAYAPENAAKVRLELEFGWSPDGSVAWDDVSLVEEPSPRDRRVKVVTVALRPAHTSGAAASVEEFCKLAEANAGAKPDVICLPEGVTLVGTDKRYPEVAESLPGPTTKRLGELAKRLNSYVVAGIYERVGPVIYNTAVLIDRKGGLVGSYRKTHLPREEVEGGLTPGDSYPTFETDFGRVGLMICWDVQFPEPARALALQGAEVLLLPIWGGSETLARARAIENHVFLISASYDMKTFVVDPSGAVLAEASTGSPTAIAEMALDRKIVQPWLGDMKGRTWKERRGDIPLPR